MSCHTRTCPRGALASTDTDGRDPQCGVDGGCGVRRNHLHEDTESAGVLQGNGVLDQALGVVSPPALHAVAAEGMFALRG